MSFGTRVRITNLRNNREVIALVDGRIPVGDPRIADISAEAGGAIGMATSGYTEVRLEQLVPAQPPAPAAVPAAPPQAAAEPAPRRPATPPPAPAASNPPAAREQETEIIEAIQVVTPQPQYVAYPQSCFSSPLCVAILVLLIIAVLLLTAILVLLLSLRRLPWWPWFYPLWVRRRVRYLKGRRL
jgi:hypothetical protein